MGMFENTVDGREVRSQPVQTRGNYWYLQGGSYLQGFKGGASTVSLTGFPQFPGTSKSCSLNGHHQQIHLCLRETPVTPEAGETKNPHSSQLFQPQRRLFEQWWRRSHSTIAANPPFEVWGNF